MVNTIEDKKVACIMKNMLQSETAKNLVKCHYFAHDSCFMIICFMNNDFLDDKK